MDVTLIPGLLLIAVLVVLYLWRRFAPLAKPPELLWRKGKVTEGVVVDLKTVEGRPDFFAFVITLLGLSKSFFPGLVEDSLYYQVIYSFQADEEGVPRKFEGTAVLSEDQNPAMLVGRTVWVRYVEDNPVVSILEGIAE